MSCALIITMKVVDVINTIISTADMVRGNLDSNGISIKTLAEACGLSERTIYRFLCDDSKLSRKIAEGVNALIPEISLEFLMTYDAKYQLQKTQHERITTEKRNKTGSANSTVRKNVTIPRYLNDRAMKAGINFSQLLQAALKQQLGY